MNHINELLIFRSNKNKIFFKIKSQVSREEDYLILDRRIYATHILSLNNGYYSIRQKLELLKTIRREKQFTSNDALHIIIDILPEYFV